MMGGKIRIDRDMGKECEWVKRDVEEDKDTP